jgi:hypothetical protein
VVWRGSRCWSEEENNNREVEGEGRGNIINESVATKIRDKVEGQEEEEETLIMMMKRKKERNKYINLKKIPIVWESKSGLVPWLDL